MKNSVFILFICSTICAAQTTFDLNTTALLEWQGKAAFSSYSPAGTLKVDKASITIKNDSILAMIVSVDMTTLSQENKQLEGHLRDADFFNVTVYSKASFTLTKAVKINAKTIVLEGLMTIRGKTQQELINAQITEVNKQYVISFDHTFDRTSYGINYNSPSIFKRIKENAIEDDFTLKGSLRFN
ncbi:MAG: YceI family protein [Gilvibacter sp.]